MKLLLAFMVTFFFASSASAYDCDGDEINVDVESSSNRTQLTIACTDVVGKPAVMTVERDDIGTLRELAFKAALSTALMAVSLGEKVEVQIRYNSNNGFLELKLKQ
ncbi:MAG: hypothetical protein GY944_08400 [bacterium]|nr:hypothetical protein [bacterium]